MTKRNEKCPCGSGKKYKFCCMQADLEKAKFNSPSGRPFEESPANAVPTWKIFIAATIALTAVSGIVWFAGFPRIAGAVFGVGMILLVFFAAFRNVPTIRKKTGDGGNIDFGTR